MGGGEMEDFRQLDEWHRPREDEERDRSASRIGGRTTTGEGTASTNKQLRTHYPASHIQRHLIPLIQQSIDSISKAIALK